MNKLAFITGATSGIGLATAKALAENGFDLALAARNEEKLYAIKNGFEKDYGVKVTPYPLDVRDRDAVQNTAGRCLSETGTPQDLPEVSNRTAATISMISSKPSTQTSKDSSL